MNRIILSCLICLGIFSPFMNKATAEPKTANPKHGATTTPGGRQPLTGDIRFASGANDPAPVFPYVVIELDWNKIESGLDQSRAILKQITREGVQDVSAEEKQLDSKKGILLNRGRLGIRTKKTFKDHDSVIHLKGDLSKHPQYLLMKISSGNDDITRPIEISTVSTDGKVSPIAGSATSEIGLSGNYLVNDTWLKHMLGENGNIVSYGKTQEEALRFTKIRLE